MEDKREQLLLEYGYNTCLKYVRELIQATVNLKMQNSQAFIDFLDSLNEESVRF